MRKSLVLVSYGWLLIGSLAAQTKLETLFVSSSEGGTITRIDLATLSSTTIANVAATPEGLTCGPDGRVYVALSGLVVSGKVPGGGPRGIISFNPDGSDLMAVLDFAATPPLDASGGPEGPSFSPEGELFFNTRASHGFPHTGVWKLRAEDAAPAQIILPFTSENGEATAFLPRDPWAGHLLAAGFHAGLVVRRAPPFDSPQPGIPFVSGLTTPNGLAINSAGDVFVAEDSTGIIKQFSPDGTFLRIFAIAGVGIRKIAFDSADTLYAAGTSAAGPIIRIAPDGAPTAITHVSGANGMAVCYVAGEVAAK